MQKRGIEGRGWSERMDVEGSLLHKVEKRGVEGRGWSVCKTGNKGAVLVGLQTVIGNLLLNFYTQVTFSSSMQIIVNYQYILIDIQTHIKCFTCACPAPAKHNYNKSPNRTNNFVLCTEYSQYED